MSDSESESAPGVSSFAPRAYFASMPRWKTGLVVGALVVMATAAITMIFGDPLPSGTDALPTTLVAGQDPTNPDAATVEQTPWSEAFFQFGFSFFIGFALGYASRAFFKFVMFLIGGMALFLFCMSYYGFVTVEWAAMDQAFSQFGTALKGQFGAFRTFITGSLPNAGLAGLGLFAGFKKNV